MPFRVAQISKKSEDLMHHVVDFISTSITNASQITADSFIRIPQLNTEDRKMFSWISDLTTPTPSHLAKSTSVVQSVTSHTAPVPAPRNVYAAESHAGSPSSNLHSYQMVKTPSMISMTEPEVSSKVVSSSGSIATTALPSRVTAKEPVEPTTSNLSSFQMVEPPAMESTTESQTATSHTWSISAAGSPIASQPLVSTAEPAKSNLSSFQMIEAND